MSRNTLPLLTLPKVFWYIETHNKVAYVAITHAQNEPLTRANYAENKMADVEEPLAIKERRLAKPNMGNCALNSAVTVYNQSTARARGSAPQRRLFSLSRGMSIL